MLPSRKSNTESCQGHCTKLPSKLPSSSGPPAWEQTAPMACISSHPIEEDLLPLYAHTLRRALSKLTRIEDLCPFFRLRESVRVIDADPISIDEPPAQPGSGGGRGETQGGKEEATSAPTSPSLVDGEQIEARSHAVGDGVDRGGGHGPVGSGGVVGEPSDGGRQGGGRPDRGQAVAYRAINGSIRQRAHGVEAGTEEPRADGDIREDRMQRMPEPGAV